jgi:hypothetical protein
LCLMRNHRQMSHENVGLTSDGVTVGACRLDSLICSVAMSGQAPQRAPNARGLRANAHTKRSFMQGDARLQAPQPQSGAPKARSLAPGARRFGGARMLADLPPRV